MRILIVEDEKKLAFALKGQRISDRAAVNVDRAAKAVKRRSLPVPLRSAYRPARRALSGRPIQPAQEIVDRPIDAIDDVLAH